MANRTREEAIQYWNSAAGAAEYRRLTDARNLSGETLPEDFYVTPNGDPKGEKITAFAAWNSYIVKIEGSIVGTAFEASDKKKRNPHILNSAAVRAIPMHKWANYSNGALKGRLKEGEKIIHDPVKERENVKKALTKTAKTIKEDGSDQ